jgi:hypothetical protein
MAGCAESSATDHQTGSRLSSRNRPAHFFPATTLSGKPADGEIQHFELKSELKLYGMKVAFDEIMTLLSNVSTRRSH